MDTIALLFIRGPSARADKHISSAFTRNLTLRVCVCVCYMCGMPVCADSSEGGDRGPQGETAEVKEAASDGEETSEELQEGTDAHAAPLTAEERELKRELERQQKMKGFQGENGDASMDQVSSTQSRVSFLCCLVQGAPAMCIVQRGWCIVHPGTIRLYLFSSLLMLGSTIVGAQENTNSPNVGHTQETEHVPDRASEVCCRRFSMQNFAGKHAFHVLLPCPAIPLILE